MRHTEEEIINFLKEEHLEKCITHETKMIEAYGLLKYETVMAERIEKINEWRKDHPEFTIEDTVLLFNEHLKNKWMDFKIDDYVYADNTVLNITASLKIRGLMQ